MTRQRLSQEITGMPPHRFTEAMHRVERDGWDTRIVTKREHKGMNCERCRAEQAKVKNEIAAHNSI